MVRIAIDGEAGRLSTELTRRGIHPTTIVHAVVDLPETDHLSIAALAEESGAFDWLLDEPDLYTDTDLLHQAD